MKVVNSITELIGKTPMIKLNKLVDENSAEVYVKLESFNPGGSVKDRIALNMIEKALENGKINENSVLVEPTSGNTGVGIAMIGAAKGLKVKLVMPDTMSIERRKLMTAFGAELVLTDGTKGMKGAIDKAKELTEENDNYFMLQQFDNPDNPSAHVENTSKEILSQMDNEVDYFIAGVGTGGTITGVGKVLKENIENVNIVAVEPIESAVMSGEGPGPHKIQGIGAGFIPNVLDMKVIDRIEKVELNDAMDIMRRLGREEGILAGISSGAAVSIALKIAKEVGKGKKIVVIAPDTGERYLSTSFFE